MPSSETQFEAGLRNAVRQMRCEDWYFRDDLFRDVDASYSRSAGGIEYTRVRFESLLAEPQREYPRLLSAAGIRFPDESLEALMGHTSFSNMRRLHHPEIARAGMVETNPVYIVRSGTADQHMQVLRGRVRQRVEFDMSAYMKEQGDA